MKREKGKPAEAPAPAKAESSRTSAAAPASKTAAPLLSTAPPKAEGPRPLMSVELPRPDEPGVAPADFSKAVQSGHVWGDTSDLAAIGRTATPAELAEFRKTVEARRKAERDQPRPADTLWRCPACGYNCRMGADQKRQPPCFRCNPMLSRSGSMMVQITTSAEIEGFLAREKAEVEARRKAVAKAREIARKRDEENTLLKKAGV
jgi:hypothetical protein